MLARSYLRPRTVGGLAGMLLVAGLYVANHLSVRAGGASLSAWWLLTLLVPGALAAALCVRRGTENACEKEGALAGLITGHFAFALLVSVLVAATLNIDWARYAKEAGPQVAAGVREAALPATLVAGAATLALTYAACVTAGWLGALVVRGVRSGRRTIA